MAAQRKPCVEPDLSRANLEEGPTEAAVRKCCVWPLLAFNFRYLARIKFCQKLPGLFRVKLGIR